MSDSILVRVTLDGYDFAHPSDKQTQVYVQIPEVARVSYWLPAARYYGLKDRAWPEVLDVAQEHYVQGWVVAPSSTVARQTVMEWLRDDANRDEMQAAYEQDQARRHPVARKLLAENERLTARTAELEKANAGLDDLRVRVLDKNDELRAKFEAQRSRADTLDRLLREAQAKLAEFERPADEGYGTKVAELIGDTKPASNGLLVRLGESVRDRREHEHPAWEDMYCLNLVSWMGERMGPVLRRLLDAEARVAELERQAEAETCRCPEPAPLCEGCRCRCHVDDITQRIAPTQALHAQTGGAK